MPCTCAYHSAFRWREFPRPSIFAGDGAFASRSDGKTASQSASEAAQRYEDRTGKSMGSMFGISDKADRRTEETIYQRQKKQRSASHYGGKHG